MKEVMPIDSEFVIRKVKLIHEDLGRLEKLSGLTFEEIERDDIKLSAAERYLERIIMRAIDINQHLISVMARGDEKVRGYEDTFHVLSSLGVYDDEFAKQIAPSAGLRNRLIHEYNDTQEEIIYQSIDQAIREYAVYCDHIIKFTESRENSKRS